MSEPINAQDDAARLGESVDLEYHGPPASSPFDRPNTDPAVRRSSTADSSPPGASATEYAETLWLAAGRSVVEVTPVEVSQPGEADQPANVTPSAEADQQHCFDTALGSWMDMQPDASDHDAGSLLTASPDGGCYEYAQSLCHVASPWQRLLALTACSAPTDVADDDPEKAPRWRRLAACVWLLAILLVMACSIGLQWALCQSVYIKRMATSPDDRNATMASPYLCRHSFVWTFLMPRLIWMLGYIVIFVCLFCLNHPDFPKIIAATYDCVTDQAEYAAVSEKFVRCCRRDRGVLVFWWGAINVLSLLNSLVGCGIITDMPYLTLMGTRGSSPLTLATYIFTCLVRLVVDSAVGHCIIVYTLAHKYLHLQLEKVAVHLTATATAQSFQHCFNYQKIQMDRSHQLMHRSQTCITTAMLLLLLRVSQTGTTACLYIRHEPHHWRPWRLVAQLPIAVVFHFLGLYHILSCIQLSSGTRKLRRRIVEELRATQPDCVRGLVQRYHQVAPTGYGAVADGPRRPWYRRNVALWIEGFDQVPAVNGRLFGVDAGVWMLPLLVGVGVVYSSVFYLLETRLPLI